MFILMSIILLLLGNGQAGVAQLRDGDIIFQTSRSDQSLAIQKATHSRFSHMGIILYRDGKPCVYEAARTVRYTPLRKWIGRGEGGHFVVKRLKNADQVLTKEGVVKLTRSAIEYQGKRYDASFEWTDDRIYCSELVWKIYDRAFGIPIGSLQKLKEFDLSDSAVKDLLRARYGDSVPRDETVISPEAIYASEALDEVLRQ